MPPICCSRCSFHRRTNGAGAWGRPTASRYGNPFLWTGQRYDAGVGLYAFPVRTYSPHLGRWLTRDPLGYVDGVNLYEYVGSMPTVYTDPFGLAANYTVIGGNQDPGGMKGDDSPPPPVTPPTWPPADPDDPDGDGGPTDGGYQLPPWTLSPALIFVFALDAMEDSLWQGWSRAFWDYVQSMIDLFWNGWSLGKNFWHSNRGTGVVLHLDDGTVLRMYCGRCANERTLIALLQPYAGRILILQIYGHGSPGIQTYGGGAITADVAAQLAALLKARPGMTVIVMFMGCNVAEGMDGAWFLQMMANILGVRVIGYTGRTYVPFWNLQLAFPTGEEVIRDPLPAAPTSRPAPQPGPPPASQPIEYGYVYDTFSY